MTEERKTREERRIACEKLMRAYEDAEAALRAHNPASTASSGIPLTPPQRDPSKEFERLRGVRDEAKKAWDECKAAL